MELRHASRPHTTSDQCAKHATREILCKKPCTLPFPKSLLYLAAQLQHQQGEAVAEFRDLNDIWCPEGWIRTKSGERTGMHRFGFYDMVTRPENARQVKLLPVIDRGESEHFAR